MTTTTQGQLPTDGADLDEAIGLLHDALAQGWAPSRVPPNAALRGRVLQRVAASAARHQGLVTVRRAPAVQVAPGISVHWLYRNQANTLRPGEPVALALLELAPGTTLTGGLGLAGKSSEWLVMRGECSVGGTTLAVLDQHCRAATAGEPVLSSSQGATVYLRNSGDLPFVGSISLERDAVWEDFGPGILRRLVWQQGGEACYLARAKADAFVPAHGHHVDEECMMLEGELFLGDILLRAGEFQLAPAGIEHGVVQAATDTLLYVRGDIAPAVELLG